MNDALTPSPAALARIRVATGEAHRRLDTRLDAVARLADGALRGHLIARYAALHLPAEQMLAAELSAVPLLDFARRRRSHLFRGVAVPENAPPFPRPGTRAEALGMFYVLEGSALGGRMILKELARRGVAHPGLAFLDPYGAETGARWRSFLAVLERETSDGPHLVADAVEGAVRGFDHAEEVLCGDWHGL